MENGGVGNPGRNGGKIHGVLGGGIEGAGYRDMIRGGALGLGNGNP